MGYFDKDYVDFFTELAFNNEKSWFDVHRKRYENSVREPFKEFTTAIINEVQKFDKSIGPLEPKDVMFRINRDIRFSKDKTPYNTWLSAAIMPGGKRQKVMQPGYYFRFAVDGVSLGGGQHAPSKEQLVVIRRKITKDPKALHAILDAKKFRDTWGEVQGDEHKVIPKEFKEAAQQEPLIKKKSFTYWKEYPEMEVLRDDLLDWVVEHYKTSKRFNEYLRT